MTAACPDKHRMKWIDTYPDEISACFDHHHDFSIILHLKIQHGNYRYQEYLLFLQGTGSNSWKSIYIFVMQLDASVAVLAGVNGPAFDRLIAQN